MQQQNNNNNNHRRQTPGRRRQSRQNHQSSPALSSQHKYYASESDVADMPVDAAFQREIADGPKTPRKFNPPSPPSSSLHPNSNSQAKPRAANKNRPKNATASPIPMKPARKTPPPALSSARTTSATAFAGATFHASPAPSSLPIPSFVARSMPDSPGLSGFSRANAQEPSPPPTDSEMPTPVHKSCAAKPTREESPLDVLFRADRAEKEKARRASSANALGTVLGPFSPPSHPRSPQRNGSALAQDSPLQQGRRPQFQRNSTTGSPAVELGDTPVKAMGPAFSTPYPERIKAARTIDKQGRAVVDHGIQQQQQQVVDRSEALKNFLFAGHKQNAPMTTGTTGGNALGIASLHSPSGSGRSQVQQVYGTPEPSNDRRPADILAIEDSLRRILKLDSPLGLAPKPPALANAHTS